MHHPSLLRSAPVILYVNRKPDALAECHTAHATHHTATKRYNTPYFEARFSLIVLFYVHLSYYYISRFRRAGVGTFSFLFWRVARGSTSLFSHLFCITTTPRNKLRSNWFCVANVWRNAYKSADDNLENNVNYWLSTSKNNLMIHNGFK
jgi:hypothetical protein